MDFEDWHMNNPAPMQGLCDLIETERRKAWNAAFCAMSPEIHVKQQPAHDADGDRLRDRCAVLHSENSDLKVRINEITEDNVKLLAEIKELDQAIDDRDEHA